MLMSLDEFVAAVIELDSVSDAYDLFEVKTAEAVRAEVYALSDPDSSEPFRSAMYNLGFVDF